MDDLMRALHKYRKNDLREEWLECIKAMYSEEMYPYLVEFRRYITQRVGDDPELNMRLLKEAYTLSAKDRFNDYMIAMEWDRDNKFYLPRRKGLIQAVEAIQDLIDDKIDLLAISMPPGVGKALANDTPILTRNGWKNHGDLKVGDEVIGIDGGFKKVINVFPKCEVDCEVEFTNGEKIRCHENHEWLVHDRSRGAQAIYETKAMERRVLDNDLVGRGHRYVLQIPSRTPILGDHKQLPIQPYTLGAWLGDGTNTAPYITYDKKDDAVIQRVLRDGYEIRWTKVHKTTGVYTTSFEGLRKDLHAYGMCYDGRRVEKFIPEEYLTASLEQRLDLLAGLLDTDGTLSHHKYTFSTADELLKNTFIDLLHTFGWRVCVREETPRTSSSGITGKKPYWKVSFSPNIYIPCQLERKQIKDFGIQRKVAIKAIRRTPLTEGNCIEVEGGVYLAGRKMIPTHNSGLGLFLITFLAGKNPELGILTSSHNMAFLQGAYEECLREIKSPDYRWNEIFPGHQVVKTNAKDLQIAIDKAQRFPSLQFGSIGSGLAGRVRALQLLLCDDLIENIEEAMSVERLESKWRDYSVDLAQRKQGLCKEVHIATRWSVHDIIGRLEVSHEGDDRARFITMPALNENGESNFDYGGENGFTTKFYLDLKANMDDVSWRALYMNEPIEREGLLYSAEDLRRYYKLPEEEPDAILAVCDTAEGGGDDTVLPVFAVYGEDHYLVDCVVTNALPEISDELCANVLFTCKAQKCQFESNSAGGRTADKVQEILTKKGGFTHITKKKTTTNKQTKIIVESDWVKKHCLFLDSSVIPKGSMYSKFIEKLCAYTQMGKNKHDDVPDAVAQYAQFYRNTLGSVVKIVDRRMFGF